MIRKPSLRRRRAAEQAPGASPTPTAAAPAAPPTAVLPVLGAAAEASAPAPTAGSVLAGEGSPVAPGLLVPLDPTAPAGSEPEAAGVPAAPGFRQRGRLRRRLRYLRRVRELGLRDLGGLVFDLHRFGREGARLVAGKLDGLAGVDAELRLLEEALDAREDVVVLREPGIASCPRCGALHGSDANFCPTCGLRFSGPQAIAPVGDVLGAVGTPPAPTATAGATPPAHPVPAEPAAPVGARRAPAPPP